MTRELQELYNTLCGHPDVTVLRDEPMSKHTTFRIGGPAELFFELKTPHITTRALSLAHKLGISPFVMGNGSNLLVDDKGIPGAVFKVSGGECRLVADTFISVDAGVSLTTLARFAARHGLCGFEFAYGIPGTVGGAVVMNAGAYGGEMQDVLIETSYISSDGEIVRIGRREHEFGYRTSFFKQHPEYTIIDVKIALNQGDKEQIHKNMDEILEKRKSKQPLELPSAGSVFKRPAGHYAGGLIEECGLKGFRIGGAEVSPKHAGFIVNVGGATCNDVLTLIEHIKETVLKKYGVTLECEVLKVPQLS